MLPVMPAKVPRRVAPLNRLTGAIKIHGNKAKAVSTSNKSKLLLPENIVERPSIILATKIQLIRANIMYDIICIPRKKTDVSWLLVRTPTIEIKTITIKASKTGFCS